MVYLAVSILKPVFYEMFTLFPTELKFLGMPLFIRLLRPFASQIYGVIFAPRKNIFNFSEKTNILIDFLSLFGVQYFYEERNVLYQT